MTTIEIEVTDDNEFNLGWLLYLLGQDRPVETEDGSNAGPHGWDMGKDTAQIKPIREVFAKQPLSDRPSYIVRAVQFGPVGEGDPGLPGDPTAVAKPAKQTPVPYPKVTTVKAPG